MSQWVIGLVISAAFSMLTGFLAIGAQVQRAPNRYFVTAQAAAFLSLTAMFAYRASKAYFNLEF